MIVLITSAGKEVFAQFVLQVLCYPTQYILYDVPYGSLRVEDRFRHKPEDLQGKKTIIVFLEYLKTPSSVEPVFYPIRQAIIKSGRYYADKLLVNLSLENFVLYTDSIKQSYLSAASNAEWNKILKNSENSPFAEQAGMLPINPLKDETWKSGGKFVFEIEDSALSFKVDTTYEKKVREECADWTSVVDQISETYQLKDKLFYQISSPRLEGGNEIFPLANFTDKCIYRLHPGSRVDLTVHFYHGKQKRKVSKKVLDVVSEGTRLSLVGSPTIDIYPEQRSGKIERLKLIVKKQLALEYTRLAIQEKEVSIPSLATAEFHFEIKPRPLYIAFIILAFFTLVLLCKLRQVELNLEF